MMSARVQGLALRYGAPFAVGIALLSAWQIVVTAYAVPSYLVPSPLAILATLQRDWGLLSRSLVFTLEITFAALLCAVVVGVATAFLFVQSRVIEASLFPYAVLLQVTPIVAIAPLIIIWVRQTTVALVLCATIVALFPIIANTLGLRSVDPGLLELFRMHRAGRWQTLARLRVPSALPYFFVGLRVSTGLALIGAVVAEFVAGTGGSVSGLAYQILLSGLQLNIPRLFAALFLIAVTGIVLSLLAALAARLALSRWHESELARDD
jgi:NitT/TauT family transport system permease protein